MRIMLRLLTKSTGCDIVFDEVRKEWGRDSVCLGKENRVKN